MNARQNVASSSIAGAKRKNLSTWALGGGALSAANLSYHDPPGASKVKAWHRSLNVSINLAGELLFHGACAGLERGRIRAVALGDAQARTRREMRTGSPVGAHI